MSTMRQLGMKHVVVLAVLCLILCVQFSGYAQESDFIQIDASNVNEIVPLASIVVDNTFGAGPGAFFSSDDQWMIVPAQQNGKALNLATYAQRYTPAYVSTFIPNTDEVFLVSGSDRLRTFNYVTGVERVWNPDISVGNTSHVVSPDGEYVVTIGQFDGIMRLWRVSDGTQIRILDNLGGFRSVVFSPDSLYLAWTLQDSQINILDLEANIVIQEIETQSGTLHYINDSSHLLICSANLELWNLDQEIVLSRSTGNTGCSITPSTNRLITYDFPNSTAGSASIYSLDNYDLSLLSTVERPPYAKMVLSNNGDWILALTSIQSPSILYDADSGQVIHTFESGIRSAEFDLDGNLLVTATFEQVDIWEVTVSGLNHLLSLNGRNFSLSPRNTTIAVNMDEVTLIYGIATDTRPALPFVVPADVVPSAIQVRANPDPNADVIGTAMQRILVGGFENNYLYVPNLGGWVRSESNYVSLAYNFSPTLFQDILPTPIVELPTPTVSPPIQTSTPMPTATPYIDTIAITPQSAEVMNNSILSENVSSIRLLGAIAFDSYLRTFSGERPVITFDSDQLIVPLNLYNRSEFAQVINLETHDSYTLTAPNNEAVYSRIISPDGSRIAYTQQGAIYVYDVANNTSEFVVGNPGQINTGWQPLGFSADGSQLAVQSYRTNTEIYDLETSTVDLELPVRVVSLLFSPLNQKIAIRLRDRNIFHILDVETGEILNYISFTGNTYSSIFSNEFSPDERYFTFVTSDGLSLYDLVTDNLILETDITEFSFTPDSQYVVLVLDDGYLHFYETATGNLANVFALPDSTNSVATNPISISPNGQLAAIGNPIQFLDIQSNELSADMQFLYNTLYLSFTPDARFLLAYDSQGLMIFGIPTPEIPEWQPISGRIVPSSINLREFPSNDAPILGQVSGTVLIAGTNLQRNAVYLPEFNGWVWGDSAYLDMNGITMAALPIVEGHGRD